MIPKIIHYCWFGGNPLPPLAKKCIESWEKHCSDWEIIEWNETNFDVNYNTYVRQAYEAKKWAFVSDVARLWALVNHGGVYMDTDCELLKPIDEFLKHEAVSGFEPTFKIPTAMMGCREGFPLFKEILLDYDKRAFLLPNGDFDTITNVVTMTKILLIHGLVLNNRPQTVKGFTLYPSEYFCPKNYNTGKLDVSENTYIIHHYSESWADERQLHLHKKYMEIRNRYGIALGNQLCKLYGALYTVKSEGIGGAIRRLRNRKV